MTAKKPQAEPVEKRKVTMKSIVMLNDRGATAETEATDYVPVDILDAYVEDARKRWQVVTVGTEHDPGPAGDRGPTKRPKL